MATRPRHARGVIAVFVTAGALAVPASALASTAAVSGGVLTYSGGSGEVNQVTFTQTAPNTVQIDDSGVVLAGNPPAPVGPVVINTNAGGNCTPVDSDTVVCTTVSSVAAVLNDQNDTLTTTLPFTIPIAAQGGTGNDNLTTGGAADTLTGGAGDDTLNGGAGSDTFVATAGDGQDTLTGGAGADTADYSSRTADLVLDADGSAASGDPGENDIINADVEGLKSGSGNDLLRPSANASGGTIDPDGNTFGGVDTVDFGDNRSTGVTVSLDGAPNDGTTGSGENANVLATAENLIGTSGADNLTGSAANNVISGLAGDDTLSGLGGNDTLVGGTGSDIQIGGDGNDTCDMGAGRTTAPPAASNDADSCDGGEGIDTVDYSSRGVSVTITQDNVANDGATGTGEGDNVGSTIEGITTGAGDDAVTASDVDNVITTNGGNDTINAGGGNDLVAAGVRQRHRQRPGRQ